MKTVLPIICLSLWLALSGVAQAQEKDLEVTIDVECRPVDSESALQRMKTMFQSLSGREVNLSKAYLVPSYKEGSFDGYIQFEDVIRFHGTIDENGTSCFINLDLKADFRGHGILEKDRLTCNLDARVPLGQEVLLYTRESEANRQDSQHDSPNYVYSVKILCRRAE